MTESGQGEEQPTVDAGESQASAAEPEFKDQAAATSAAVDPPPPPPPLAPAAPSAVDAIVQTEKTLSERKALLANTLQGQVASGGRIESQGDFQAVVIRGHRTNHLLHFLIGIFTLGVWWIVWFFIAIFGGEKRQMVNVDQFGNVFVQKV